MVVCGITAEYSDLNPTPPTEVILIGPDTEISRALRTRSKWSDVHRIHKCPSSSLFKLPVHSSGSIITQY